MADISSYIFDDHYDWLDENVVEEDEETYIGEEED